MKLVTNIYQVAISEEVFKVGAQRSRSYVYKCVNGVRVPVHLFEYNRNVCILAAEESPSTSCQRIRGFAFMRYINPRLMN